MPIKINEIQKVSDQEFLSVAEFFKKEDEAQCRGLAYQTKVNLKNRYSEKECQQARAMIDKMVQRGQFTESQAENALKKYNGGFKNSTVGRMKEVIAMLKSEGMLIVADATRVLNEKGRPYKEPKKIPGHYIIKRTQKFYNKLDELRNQVHD